MKKLEAHVKANTGYFTDMSKWNDIKKRSTVINKKYLNHYNDNV